MQEKNSNTKFAKSNHFTLPKCNFPCKFLPNNESRSFDWTTGKTLFWETRCKNHQRQWGVIKSKLSIYGIVDFNLVTIVIIMVCNRRFANRL